MEWFLRNRPDLARHVSSSEVNHPAGKKMLRLLAVPSRERLERLLRHVFDTEEFLSPYGIRSLSKIHAASPYGIRLNGTDYSIEYRPGESDSGLFGGNSNWRGPVWFPINYLLVEALERYHHFYGEDFRVELPTGSGHWATLREASRDLAHRLSTLFTLDAQERRPCLEGNIPFPDHPDWRDHLLFHEYFHGDNGAGLGASHQTGWTALVNRCLGIIARSETE
jgi:hypothetical protein